MFLNQDCAVSTKPIVAFYPSNHLITSIRPYLNLWVLLVTFTVIETKVKELCKGGDCTSLDSIFTKLFRRIIQRSQCKSNFIKKYLGLTLDGLAVFLSLLNIVLIVICNPSMLNPGPKPFSIFYNNIQGFFNTRDLASDSPPLNMTKVHELHGYFYSTKPDIIILNETWLKKSISDIEVIPDNYKVFRIDRSIKSHPWDPSRPKKFRKHGGGVLIAHRSDLDISSIQFTKIKVQAELLSVIFKTASGKQFCISTFYRVP